MKVVIGQGSCGIATGAKKTSDAFEQLVAEKGLKDVTITKAGCIGTCYLEPIVDVYGDDDELEARYVKIQPDKVAEIVDKHLIGKTPVEELAISEEDKKFLVTAIGNVDVGGFISYPGSVTFDENCTVEGKIDVSGVTSADNFAGGFFANYGWGDNIGKGDHKVTSCSADVDITTKYASAGGFVGSGTNSEGKNKNITLTNCEAKGTVTLVEGGTANIGGFAGQTDRGIYINCTAAQPPFIGKVLDGYTLTDDGNGTLTVIK